MAILRLRDENGNVHEVVALKGEKGDKGNDGNVSFDELTDEQKASLKGERGETGADGVGIESAFIINDELVINYTDGTGQTVGRVVYNAEALQEEINTLKEKVESAEYVAGVAVESIQGAYDSINSLDGRIASNQEEAQSIRGLVDSLANNASQTSATLSEHTTSIHNLGEQLGDVETALDGIIAIQENLIGGASV